MVLDSCCRGSTYMRSSLLLTVFTVLSISGCTQAEGTVAPKHFNAPAFAGLADSPDGPYPSVRLDFWLDTSNGNERHFVSCPQIEATDIDAIRTDQHPVFRLLQVNCLALKRYAEGRSARVSHLPLDLTGEFIGDLPGGALPLLSKEGTPVPDDRLLKSSTSVEAIESLADGRVRVLTASEEIYYVPLARADFDGDGRQDILLRLDWRAREAFGKGVDLIQVIRRAPGENLQVTCRMPRQ